MYNISILRDLKVRSWSFSEGDRKRRFKLVWRKDRGEGLNFKQKMF